MDDSPPDDSDPRDRERYHAYSVSDDESHMEAVVRGVARVTGHDALEMEPLAHSIDPAVVDAVGGLPRDASNSLAFAFEGREVVVTPTRVYVRRDEGESPSSPPGGAA